MIRTQIIRNHLPRVLCTASVIVLSIGLSSCMTSQKQAAVVDDSQDVAAILPATTPQADPTLDPANDATRVATAQNASVQPDMVASNTQPARQPVQQIVAASNDGAAPGDQVPALGIMQSTRVNANAGSIFSSVTSDQAAYDPNDPNASAAGGTSVKPIKNSLFSNPVRGLAAPQPTPDIQPQQQQPVIAATDPTQSSDYDAGIVVLHRQTDEERRIMAEKNDLTKNAHPQIRAMEPDSQAAPANDRSTGSNPAKKRWSLKDMFGGLGKNSAKANNSDTQ